MEQLKRANASRKFRIELFKRNCPGKTGQERNICPQCTQQVIGKIRDEVLEDVEERSILTQNIMRKSTDFQWHVGAERKGRVAITFTYVCEYCKLFPVVEDFLCWVFTNHG